MASTQHRVFESPAAPAPAEIKEESARILPRKSTAISAELSRLLHTVRAVLNGAQIDEPSLRTTASEQNGNFPPRLASILRVQACRVRNRLRRYYRTLGVDDPIEITLSPRTFLPLIRWLGTGGSPQFTATARLQFSIGFRRFRHLSSDPYDLLFCEDLTKEVLSALRKETSLRVAEIPDEDVTLAEIGRDHNVGAVLDGKLRRTSGRLRISVQLTSPSDGALIWSEMYDCQLDSQISICEDVGRAIAQATVRCADVSRSSPAASAPRA